MPLDEEELRIAIAKRSSEMMISTMDAACVPRDVQLEAVLLSLGVLFVRNVKPEHVVGVFNSSMKRLRDDIKTTLVNQKAGKKCQ